MSTLLCRILMWLGWWLSAMSFALNQRFLVKLSPHTNTFSPIDLMVVTLVLLSILACLGLHWGIRRIRNIWLALPLFGLGLVLGIFTEGFGFFLREEFLLAFEILGGLILLSFLPVFVRNRPVGVAFETRNGRL